ncbi:pyridoxamine 5'-phosphate oxidase family protein [Lacisediminihabitans sp.]|uniref:pyridoxamine 5'-phosphate oxidase family protein n=1 Tax=Lacisediminihabitans sp. TaxID=2787631 RepID=UPI00374D6D5B
MTDTRTDVSTLTDLIEGIRFATLTTIDDVGKMVARPMTLQRTECNGDLWFLSARDATAVTQLAINPGCGVTLASGDTWISLSGTGEMVDDPALVKEMWNPWVEAWFPEGPDDPNVVLIKFSSDSAEYWDTPGGRLATVISLLKSKVTGERYDGGENAKIEL